jgi:aspartate/tyrosine/aromatic aminotransferase
MHLMKHSGPTLQLLAFVVLAAVLWQLTAPAAAAGDPVSLPNPTHSGYLDIQKNAGSKIYYQYYEADSKCSPGSSSQL